MSEEKRITWGPVSDRDQLIEVGVEKSCAGPATTLMASANAAAHPIKIFTDFTITGTALNA